MAEEKTEITKPTDFEVLNLAKQPCLVVMSGKDLARKYSIAVPEIIIGRSSDANIILKEHNISRRHARIVIDGERAVLEDLGSTNGTYVNSERITKCQLEDGDLISIGKTILKFSFQSDIDSAFHDEIYNTATHDEMTTLFNRKYFQNHIEAEFARVERYGRDVSLLFLDLDDFKQVNDQFGHQAGDQVLKLTGKTIKSCIRGNIDIPARFGGEEFAILLPETNPKYALKIAEKIRKKIEDLEVDFQGKKIRITVSIGLSGMRTGIASVEDWIREADQNLYEAKRKGKNRTEIS
jgi:diguanylate cyclase (GGDEF)-like protein